jgi:hypothetical protein
VEYNCGGDIVGLLNYVLSCKRYSNLNLINTITTNNSSYNKIKKLLSLLATASNTLPLFEKRQYLSLMRNSGFTLQESKNLGFSCSSEAWTTANTHTPGGKVSESRGRKKQKNNVLKKIKDFVECDDISRPSSYQTIQKNKGEVVIPVRYFNTTIKESYELFCNNYPSILISESNFRKQVKSLKHLKKAKKQTDKCQICVAGKKIEKKIKNLKEKLDREVNETLHNKLDNEMKQSTVLYDNYLQHRKDASHQLSAMKEMINNLGDKEVILVFDFKANIIIDQDPEYQNSKDFYQNVQRTCFGVVAFYKQFGEIKHHYFDYFSDYLIHNSYFVTKALDNLLNSAWFKNFKFNTVKMWMDNGPHFRTKEMFYFFYSIKSKFSIQQVAWNFFIEGHGKSCCDRRFAQINAMYKKHINNPKNPRVTSTELLVSCIKAMSYNASVKSTQILLNINSEQFTKSLNIKNFRFWVYAFKINYEKKKIIASYLTNEKKCRSWKINIIREPFSAKESPIYNVPTEEELEASLLRLSDTYKERKNFEKNIKPRNKNKKKKNKNTNNNSNNTNSNINIEPDSSEVPQVSGDDLQELIEDIATTNLNTIITSNSSATNLNNTNTTNTTTNAESEGTIPLRSSKRKRTESLVVANKKQHTQYIFPENALNRLPSTKKRKHNSDSATLNKKQKINTEADIGIENFLRNEISNVTGIYPVTDSLLTNVVDRLEQMLIQ